MTRATCDLIEEADRLTRMSVASLRERNSDKLIEEHSAIITALQARNSRLAANLLKKTRHRGSETFQHRTRMGCAASIVRTIGGYMSVQPKPQSEKNIATHGHFIDGREVAGEASATIPVHNPATGEVIAEISHGTAGDVDRAMKSARRAFQGKD
jgi:hypothetical protein